MIETFFSVVNSTKKASVWGFFGELFLLSNGASEMKVSSLSFPSEVQKTKNTP